MIDLASTYEQIPGPSNRRSLSRTVLFALLVLPIVPCVVRAQHEGPPGRVGPTHYTSDRQRINVDQLVGIVRPELQRIISDTNENLRSKGVNLRVELESNFVSHLNGDTTEYLDRPNEFFVGLQIHNRVDFKVPVVGLQSTEIDISLIARCDGWQTGNGAVRVRMFPLEIKQTDSEVRAPTLIEEVVESIKEQINRQMPPLLENRTSLKGRCVTIGPSTFKDPNASPAYIAFDPPPPSTLGTRIGGQMGPEEKVQVEFLTLKRLVARYERGGPKKYEIYSETENIVLEASVNFDYRVAGPLTMREGDLVNLNMAPVVLIPPLIQLVIIASITQEPVIQLANADRAFDDLARGERFGPASYSPGLHVLTINKHPAALLSRGVPGYELSYRVTLLNNKVTRPK
jgi:hypothetical protein